MPNTQIEKPKEENLTSAGRQKVVWSRKKIAMAILFSVIILISVAVLVWTFVDDTFLFTIIRDFFILPLLDIGLWAYLVFLVLMIIQSLIAPIPSELILLSAGILFGLWPGMAIGVIGSVVSGVVTYFLAVKGGRPIIESAGEYVSLADKFILVVDMWIEKWGIWSIIVGRAVPLIMFDPVSYAAGLSKIKWKPYTLATFIGSIPRAIFFAYFGSTLIPSNVIDKADYIRNLPQVEFESVAGQFNTIFYIIFGVLVLMLLVASFLSNRVAKKREIEIKEIIGKVDIIPEKNVRESDSKTRENNEEETD